MTVIPASLPFLQRLWLIRGRFRRFFLGMVRRGYVRESLARRIGQCHRCGACCQMGARCTSLSHDGTKAGCRRYKGWRPLNCRNFPIDERDLAERDQIAPHHPCGYRFRRRR